MNGARKLKDGGGHGHLKRCHFVGYVGEYVFISTEDGADNARDGRIEYGKN